MSILRIGQLQGISQTNFEITVPTTHKLIVNGTFRTSTIQSLGGNSALTIASDGSITSSSKLNLSTNTQGFVLPRGTTAQRESSPAEGTVRLNTTDNQLEVYISATGGWGALAGSKPDGSSADKAATSVQELTTTGGVSTNGVYWLKGASGTAYQTYVIMDTVYDGGKWELVYNIDANNTTTSVGGIPHYDNNTFWQTANESNQTSVTPWATNVKTRTFDQRVITEILIILHNRNGFNQANCRGWSVYSNNNQTGKTFFTIHTQGTNSFISSGGRKTWNNYVGNISHNGRRPQSRGGDLFVDGTVNGTNNANDRLIANATGYWGSDTVNNIRLSTTAGSGNSSYGHTYAGIGIRHSHAGWGFYYAMAPVSAYCEPPAFYGNQDANGFNQASSPNSGNLVLTQCDGRGWANGFIPCGYAIFVR
jgi:hypothetical protein